MGKFKLEIKLKDKELLEILGISCILIWEVLLWLEDDGLVIIKVNRWMFVVLIEVKEVENLYFIVWMFEKFVMQ